MGGTKEHWKSSQMLGFMHTYNHFQCSICSAPFLEREPRPRCASPKSFSHSDVVEKYYFILGTQTQHSLLMTDSNHIIVIRAGVSKLLHRLLLFLRLAIPLAYKTEFICRSKNCSSQHIVSK